VELGEGRPERALQVLAEGVSVLRSEGPAVFMYRGEALRVLGRFDEAERDLQAAVAERPTRLSAWINLALARRALGNSDADALARVETMAPRLLGDATAEVGADRALEHTLVMMRGNRSSTCWTYFTQDGRLQLVARRGS
jgi:predicted Zn-dependent protease